MIGLRIKRRVEIESMNWAASLSSVTAAADVIKLIRVYIFLLNGRINAYRNGHRAKGDMRSFQLRRHNL